MIAAYVRVSGKSQTLTSQRDAITRVARARGVLIAEWYAERVSSRNERPELTRLKNDARAGRLSKLYVFRLDRLSRGGICETVNLIHELRGHGCKIESIGDGFSFEGPGADVVLAVLAWAAEMERNAIRERISAARARVEAHGGAWGRPSVVDESAQERITNMKGKGYSVRKIAKIVKLPPSTVGDFIKRLSEKGPPKRSASNGKKKAIRPLAIAASG
jgi:DNA invertase Pin-like site-specific DNA recombinase